MSYLAVVGREQCSCMTGGLQQGEDVCVTDAVWVFHHHPWLLWLQVSPQYPNRMGASSPDRERQELETPKGPIA